MQNVNLKKYYYFYAIINEEYYKKIQISLKNPNENIIPDSIAHYDYYDKQGFSKKEIIKLIAKDRKVSKNEIYQHFIGR